jgi:glycogen operon protein
MGSSDIFEHRSRKSWASINFIAAHDGFTLHDAVTYIDRHNEANGENGHDGHGENLSHNWGFEGETDDMHVNKTRTRVKRAMLATLMLSHGTPMLLGGDEFCRTQKGNNNAYCQNNEISWFDWTLLVQPEALSLTQYVAELIALRKSHPSLRSEKFLHGDVEVLPGIADVGWFDETGNNLSIDAWSDTTAQLLTLCRAVITNGEYVDVTLLMLNASNEDHEFLYPHSHLPWGVKLNSADAKATVMSCAHHAICVKAHSLILSAATVSR